MRRKAKIIMVMTFLTTLIIGPLSLNDVTARETVVATPDDTWGVWLFFAGTTIPGGAPTDEIIESAIYYDLLDYIGDTAEEVYDFGYGPSEPIPGHEDTTVSEVVEGLTAIDDFGYISYETDDAANFDTGSEGYFIGGLDAADTYVIVSDGIVATGVLGPSGAANDEEAEEAIKGYEIFIFEDAELSGMIVTLSNSLGLSISFTIEDLQVDPPTAHGADDILIAIDLDSLPGFDGTFIDAIRIQDDGLASPSVYGDTTLEIDAIATKSAEMRVPPVEDTEAYIEYVNETIQDLPDGIFNRTAEDVPDIKNDFSDLFNDTLENVNEGNYTLAVEKLHMIEQKMYEEMVECAERQELIVLIDDLIAHLETLL